MNKETAKEVSERIKTASGELNEALRTIWQACDVDERILWRSRFGTVLGTLFDEVMRPLFDEHPSCDWVGKETSGPESSDSGAFI